MKNEDTTASADAGYRNPLSEWVALWHPAYGRTLAALLVIGTVVGGLVYLENRLLQGLVQSLSDPSFGDSSFLYGLITSPAGRAGAPFVFLGAVFLAGIMRALLSARRDILSGRMYIRSKNDLEKAVLVHLMNREDAFFSKHSLGEIMNRMEVDTYRIIERRETMIHVWWSSLIIISNLIFFGLADWRLALVVLVICIIGTYMTHLVSRPVQEADRRYFLNNDRVKMDFEDYVKAVPEIQVGGLFYAILKRFSRPQGQRKKAFMDWIRADTRVNLSRSVWPVMAFTLTVLIILYARSRADADEARQLALIPVLIFALPGVFHNIMNLIGYRISFRLAGNSIQRVLEYTAPGVRPFETELVRGTEKKSFSVEMQDVSFEYTNSDGTRQGGVSDISLKLESGTWTALAGSAGSGKSTLVHLLLGRLSAENGKLVYAGTDIDGMTREQISSMATLMPQHVVLFDTSILENVLIGLRQGAEDYIPDSEDHELFESTGLAQICRLKALDLKPVDASLSITDEDLASLRRAGRDAAAGLDMEIARFEDGCPDPLHPVFDALTGGRSDRDRAVEILVSSAKEPWFRAMVDSGLGAELIEQGEMVIDRSRHLLLLDDYAEYARLLRYDVSSAVWKLRKDCLALMDEAFPGPDHKSMFALAGLTSLPAERGVTPGSCDFIFHDLREKYPEQTGWILEAISGCWRKFDFNRLHPFLSWRENLLFGSIDLTNQRQRRLLDDALLEKTAAGPYRDFFTSQGMSFMVGRNGSRLSGGQRQIVSLVRSLMRRTPVLVLDEPTSALDPASRDRVCEFLERWSGHRVILTISHDPAFIHRAGRILVMDGGRLAGDGSFEELEESSGVFRRIFRLGGSEGF